MATVKIKFDNCEAASKAMDLCDNFARWGTTRQYGCVSRDLYVDLDELSKEDHPDDVAAGIRGVASLLGGEFD